VESVVRMGESGSALPRGRARVMLVEDESATAAALRKSLARLGYQVAASVPSGEEALTAARRHRVDVVLMDARLQGDAKELREAADAPVIYLGAAEPEALDGAREGGSHGSIARPFEEKDLRAAIETALRDSAARREREAEGTGESRERHLQEVIDHSPALVYMKDLQGRYTLANREFERVFRTRRADLRGKVDREALPLELRDALQADDERVLREGTPLQARVQLPGDEGPHDYVALRFPLLDAAGRLDGVYGVFTDITEMTRAEAALRQTEARYRMIAESSTDVITLTAADGVLRYVSPASRRLLGYEPSELVGISGLAIIHPDDADRVRATPTPPPQEGIAPPITFRARKKSGEYVWVEASLRAIEEPISGEGPLVLAVARDVTERRRVEEEVLRLNQELERRVDEKTRLLSVANRELESVVQTVSHDLRAPIRGISQLADALREDYPLSLPPEGSSLVDRIQAASRQLSDLVNELMSFAQSRKVELRKAPVDLSALAEDVLAALRRAEPERDMEARVTPGLVAQGDAPLLRLVLENLIGNAWKFTRGRKHAIIEFGSVLGANGEVEYHVRDNGAGFDMAAAGRLFEPFQRLHPSRDYPGTGLGLSSVRRIVERHGGRVWAEGRVGEGATFHFTL